MAAQYPLKKIGSLIDLRNLMLRGAKAPAPTPLDSIATIDQILSPNEVDHYQIRRVMDIYVAPIKEDLAKLARAIDDVVASTPRPEEVTVTVRGAVSDMQQAFSSFALGLVLAVVLVYLVLVAQFRSFVDPVIILLALPPGASGAILMLLATGTTVNVMSLMGMVMLSGVVVSDSILIVQFANHLRSEGERVEQAVAQAGRARLRPVLMTSIATVIGLIPMALKLGTGSETYAPLAQVMIGGVSVSMLLTVFVVPAAYLLIHRRREQAT
jgi:multidrug efflux pump subunit AcrB